VSKYNIWQSLMSTLPLWRFFLLIFNMCLFAFWYADFKDRVLQYIGRKHFINCKSTKGVLYYASRPSEVYSIQHYVIKFVDELWQVGGFLQDLPFPPPIKLTAMIYSWNIVDSGVKHHNHDLRSLFDDRNLIVLEPITT
jgi:hypothetical protein